MNNFTELVPPATEQECLLASIAIQRGSSMSAGMLILGWREAALRMALAAQMHRTARDYVEHHPDGLDAEVISTFLESHHANDDGFDMDLCDAIAEQHATA